MPNINEREQLDQRVRESTDLLASIIGSAMDAIIVVDDAQRIVLFNAAAEKIFACPANEAIGDCVERFIPQRFRAGHSERVRRFAESGVTDRTFHGLGTLWGLRATGEEFPIEASISKVESSGKNFFTVVIRDITQRQRAEEVLRKSEEKFLKLFRGSPVAVALSSVKDGRFIEVNNTFERFFGYRHEEVIGSKVSDIGIWVDPSQREGLTKRLLSEGSVRDLELRFRTKNGDILTCLVSAEQIEVGSEHCILSVTSDITERKLAEEALRTSEERFRLAALAGRMFAYEWDAATDEITRSGDFAHILGSDEPLETTGQQILGRIHPDERERVVTAVAALSPENPHLQISYRMARRDGTFIWVERNSLAHFDEQGRMLRLVGMVADITERKLAEDAIRESEVRYRRIVETANEGVWLLDSKLHSSYVNRQMAEMLGYAPGEMIGRSVLDFYFPEDVERKKQLLSRRQQGRREQLDERLRRKDGSELWVRIAATPVFNDNGEFDGALAMMSDITERKLAEEALQESEKRFRLVANTAPVMIWMSGLDKKPTYFNQLWLDFTGLSETELQNGLAGVVHPEDYPQCHDIYCRGFDQRQPFRKEGRLRRHDGQYRWMLDIGVPRFHKDGSFAGYIGSCIDVTDHKLAEEALSGISRKLIAAQEQERTRIARELHDDISQRMALLSVLLEGLKQDLRGSDVQVSRRINEAQACVSDLASDIQALSHRLHSSKLEYLGLGAAAEGFCKELSAGQNVEIAFQSQGIPKNLPQEISLCIFRVLQEALQNALKYSGARRFEVSLAGAVNEIELTVHDSGVGFDPEKAIGGQGIGLTGMKERLKIVQGHLAIDSKLQGGTTIHARVPLSPKVKSAGADG